MAVYLFPLYATVHFAALIWCIQLIRTRHAPGISIIALIAAGLVYDNSMISLGAVIGVGDLLEALSWPRFAMHALVTPFMMLAATGLAVIGGIRWASSTAWKIIVWILVAAGVVLGAMDHLIGLELHAACKDGIVRYTQNLSAGQFCFPDQEVTQGAGPPIPSIAGNVLALIVGFGLWRRSGWPWLMVGAIVMFAAASVPMSGFGLAPGNGGEVILIMSFVMTYARFAPRKAGAPT